ncbi:MAG: hypothetical protein EOO10_04500 [Chitinophagaceae bacterium]|nr:MAG: hypothetical protein EOO10_04500 [Chitinophagaceae bacterium]
MPEKLIQEYLFQHIKELLPKGAALVDVIAETLHVSPDSAYRRIRGETQIVLEEAKVLCNRYSISLDQLLNLRSGSVVFDNVVLGATTVNFTTYLTGILSELKTLDAYQEKNITYITNDLPFFYQFCYQPLFAFRYFFWMKTMVQDPAFLHQKFSLNCLPPATEEIGREVLAVYSKIPSTEIWNTESINGILTQIIYYLEAGIITKADAAKVYEAVHKTIEHIEQQAEWGCKFLPGENLRVKKENFRLFHNRVGLGDNTILTTRDDAKKLYLNYDALSYMTTTDEMFCNMVQQQLQTIIRRSTLISTVSEKQRNIFFNILYSKFPAYDATKTKLST